MAAQNPVTFGVKVIRDDGPGGHVHFDLFAGRTPSARGRSGRLVLRHDEFEEFAGQLDAVIVRYPLECAPDCGCSLHGDPCDAEARRKAREA